MKFATVALVMAVACLVVGQTKEEEDMCMSPAIQLRNVARQTTLVDMEQVLKEVRDAVVNPNTKTQPLQPEPEPSTCSNQVSLLTRKTPLNSLYLLIIMTICQCQKTFIGGAVCREFESKAPAAEEMLDCVPEQS